MVLTDGVDLVIDGLLWSLVINFNGDWWWSLRCRRLDVIGGGLWW